jgi:transcriptional regulator with XRE-family HTH domain/quercetin dioxygenase-like cupin family protein
VSQPTAPPLGRRIRAERTRRGMSVRGLARDIGVSPSLISQIETDKSQPSVSTLYAITTVLDITIEELFGEPHGRDEEGEEVSAGEAREPAAPSPRRLGGLAVHLPAPRRSDGPPRPIVRPDEHEVLTLDSGVTWERLGEVPHTHVDFLLITYRPGSTSSSSGELMRHSGTEFGYLLSGSLVLTLGFDEYRLSAGDAVSFDSTTPHGYRNDGVEPAVGVWFVLERV